MQLQVLYPDYIEHRQGSGISMEVAEADLWWRLGLSCAPRQVVVVAVVVVVVAARAAVVAAVAAVVGSRFSAR